MPVALTSPRFTSSDRLQKASENNPALKAGETSEAVRILQMALIDLGYTMPVTTGNGTRLPDGIFGSETTATVQRFQQANGLSADGIVGRDTLTKLEALTIASSEQQAKLEALKAWHRSARG